MRISTVYGALIAAAIGAVAMGGQSGTAGAAAVGVQCTNPVSGATWQILVDYDKATVDSYPAHVTDSQISWHDAKDLGNYTLDRGTGSLTAIFASSTGGYTLQDKCVLGK